MQNDNHFIFTARSVSIFLESLGGGGAEYAMITLANKFSENGIKVELIICKSDGEYRELISHNVTIVELKEKNLYLSLPKLIVHFKKNRPKVILVTLDLANLIVLIARRISSVKMRVVIRIANTVSVQKRLWPKKKLEQFLLHWIYPWADKIISVSNSVGDDLSAYAKIPRENITTIYNPVITPHLKKMVDEPLYHPWFDQNLPVILGVGRLTEQKDYITLIYAFQKTFGAHSARLLILGEGEQRPYLESLIRELGIQDLVALPGFVKNPFKYMKRASVYVLSSAWEGLPATLIQAMACGCPVISTDCPSGPNEILDQGKYGFLVPVGDIDAMAEAINFVLSGKKKIYDDQWGEKFTLENTSRQYFKTLFE